MRGAEGVGDIDVAMLAELAGEVGVARLLAGVEAQVLEQQHLAGLERLHGGGGDRAGAVGGEGDRATEPLGQYSRHRLEAEGGIGLALRTAEMAHEHHRGPGVQRVLDGG